MYNERGFATAQQLRDAEAEENLRRHEAARAHESGSTTTALTGKRPSNAREPAAACSPSDVHHAALPSHAESKSEEHDDIAGESGLAVTRRRITGKTKEQHGAAASIDASNAGVRGDAGRRSHPVRRRLTGKRKPTDTLPCGTPAGSGSAEPAAEWRRDVVPRLSNAPELHGGDVHVGDGRRGTMSWHRADAQQVDMHPSPVAAQSSHGMVISDGAEAATWGTKRKREDIGANAEAALFQTRRELLRALLGHREQAIDNVEVGFVHREPANRDVDR